jgi:hypothetical protein
MPRVSFAFFTVAAIYGLIGMVWGNQMGASGDHSTLAGHAHLNLLGWVSLSIMGGFYALTAGRTPAVLAWANLALSGLGAALMATAMVQLLAKQDQRFVPMVIAGDITSMLGMLLFLIAVLWAWRRSARPAVA